MKLAFIGTGYVGLVTGTCFSDLGHRVICVDVDKKKIDLLNRGGMPLYEPGLQEVVKRNLHKRLFFTTDLAKAVKSSDVVFIAVSTPPKPNGEADIRNVLSCAREIGKALNAYKIVVNKSTVPIGMTHIVGDILRRSAPAGSSFDVVSNPEFLREGTAVQDLFKPDRVVIGARNREAGLRVAEIYRPLSCPVLIMDPESAEMVKYASNSFLATKISYINEVANLCERVGADVLQVVKGMALDARIGGQFFSAGLGFGGSCFPKDVAALNHIGKKQRTPFRILPGVLEVNKKQRMMFVDKVRHLVGPLKGRTLAVWGLAFKPNTDDMREAPSLDILPKLISLGARVKAYDPVAAPFAKRLMPRVKYCANAYEAARGADAVLLLTEWNEFKEIDLNHLKTLLKRPILVDGRNVYDPAVMASKGFQYAGMGRGLRAGGA